VIETGEGALIRFASVALRLLAVIRLVNGFLALVLPAVLVRRTSADPDDTSPFYAFRMFGIRNLVIGTHLLILEGAPLRRASKEAVIIHSSDTVCAAIGGLRGDLPPRAARITVGISAVNTALAVLAKRERKVGVAKPLGKALPPSFDSTA